MQKNMSRKIQFYINEHARLKRRNRIVTILACAVLLCVICALIIPVAAMTGNAYCGKEEHIHSDKCYEKVLVCGKEEAKAHEHTDECYETKSVLTCGKEEGENHTHDESCYKEEKVLICEKSTDDAQGHVHTDSCYKKKLVCGKEEHTHTLSCYSNPKADLETSTDWESTIPEDLGSNLAENVASVAKSQVGYEESAKNYEVDDDGTTIHGYTRYGEWYGNPYGDWSAMFASFSLYYAGVDQSTIPYASVCTYWVSQLQSAGLYEKAAKSSPELGALVFFDTDDDGLANSVAIVTEVAKDGKTFEVVAGDVKNAVAEQSYSTDDSSILGYCAIPQNKASQNSNSGISVASASGNDSTGSSDTDTSSSANTVDLTSYLKNAKIAVDGKEYEEGTTISATKDLVVDLTFSGIPGKNGQTSYTYTLPEGITLQDDVTDEVLKDSDGNAQGTYSISKDAQSGRMIAKVTLNDSYVNANDYISLSLGITAQWDFSEDGEHSIDFGNGHVKKVIVNGTSKLSIDKTHTQTDERTADYSIIVTAATAQQKVNLSDSVSYSEISYTDSDGASHKEKIGAQLKTGGTIEAILTDKDGNSKTLKTALIEDSNSLSTFLSELNDTNLSMDAGDTLKINYPMEYPVVNCLKADVYGCNLDTVNSASVTSSTVTEELTAKEEWKYYGNKKHIIQKDAELEGDSAKWDLTINYGGNYPMAGTDLYDVLKSDALTYDQTKNFVIKVYQRDGTTLVREDNISWDSILTSDSRGWNYTIPETDGTNQYIYLISYYTLVTDDSAKSLNNAAGARFSQYPETFGEGGIGTGTETDARKIEIEVQKEGTIVDDVNRITEWTIKYMVLPGSGEIKKFLVVDSMPSYTVDGGTKYAKLIKKDGTAIDVTDGNDPVDSSNNSTGAGDIFTISISSYLNSSEKNPDYTTDEFAALTNYKVFYWHDNGDEFAFVNYENPDNDYFTLPAAVGDYSDGYVVTIKYQTKSEGIADGDSLTNKAGIDFSDLNGNIQWLEKSARATFPINNPEDSVTMDKTGSYDEDADKAHYTINVDTRNVGFSGANYVTFTDTFDERLSFDSTSYYLAIGVPTYTLPNIPVYTKEVDESLVKTEKVETPDGFNGTTWKTTYPDLEAYKKNESGEIEKVTNPYIYTIVDNDNHTFTFYVPESYMWYLNGDYHYWTYTLDYDLSIKSDDRTLKDVKNTVVATGDNGVRYGTAETTFSFARVLTTKTLTDANSHTHSDESDCYTYEYDETNDKWETVQTCPLTSTNKNTVLFKVRVNFGDSAVKDMKQLIVDDYLDSNALAVDVKDMQLRFVNIKEHQSLTFKDVCGVASISGASYSTELTQSGLSVTINLGQKDGKDCTVESFIEAFNSVTWFKEMVGNSELDLADFKLELSYPAEVKGNLGETVTVTNKANLRGVSGSDSSVEYDKVIEGSGGSVSGQSYTINVWKIDSVSEAGQITSLPGASFDLCDKDGNVIVSATTNSDGKAAFGTKGDEGAGQCTLKPYTAYYLVETAAPSDYVLDTTKHWFYFTAPDGTAEQEAFTEEEKKALEALGCVPMSMDSTLQVINSKTVSFNIKKVDDTSLEVLTGAEFTLYSDESCKTAIETSRTSGDGIYIIDNLNTGTTYYLKETQAPENYEQDENAHTVVVSSNGAISIDGAALDAETYTYTYKNTEKKYELPETGGMGTLIFTICGTLVIGVLVYRFGFRRKTGKHSVK